MSAVGIRHSEYNANKKCIKKGSSNLGLSPLSNVTLISTIIN